MSSRHAVQTNTSVLWDWLAFGCFCLYVQNMNNYNDTYGGRQPADFGVPNESKGNNMDKHARHHVSDSIDAITNTATSQLSDITRLLRVASRLASIDGTEHTAGDLLRASELVWEARNMVEQICDQTRARNSETLTEWLDSI